MIILMNSNLQLLSLYTNVPSFLYVCMNVQTYIIAFRIMKQCNRHK